MEQGFQGQDPCMESAVRPDAPKTAPAPGERLSRRQFYRQCRGSRNLIRIAAIVGYAYAALTLVTGMAGIVRADWYILVEVGVALALTLCMQVFRSRVCAIFLFLLPAVSCAYTLLTRGEISAYLGIVAGVLAITGTFLFASQWKRYRRQP